jgi:hypothetical protein
MEIYRSTVPCRAEWYLEEQTYLAEDYADWNVSSVITDHEVLETKESRYQVGRWKFLLSPPRRFRNWRQRKDIRPNRSHYLRLFGA